MGLYLAPFLCSSASLIDYDLSSLEVLRKLETTSNCGFLGSPEVGVSSLKIGIEMSRSNGGVIILETPGTAPRFRGGMPNSSFPSSNSL